MLTTTTVGLFSDEDTVLTDELVSDCGCVYYSLLVSNAVEKTGRPSVVVVLLRWLAVVWGRGPLRPNQRNDQMK